MEVARGRQFGLSSSGSKRRYIASLYLSGEGGFPERRALRLMRYYALAPSWNLSRSGCSTNRMLIGA